MKLQRSTLILVGVALVLGAGVLIAEGQRGSSDPLAETQTAGQNPLYDFAEADVLGLTVERNGETLVFERDQDDTWAMVAPEAAPAEPGAIAFLLSRLVSDTPQQEITITPDQQREFGLDRPSGQVEVRLKDGTIHRLVLGSPDFSGSALYVSKDLAAMPVPADAEEMTVYVVSQDLANGVTRPQAEWLMAREVPEPEADSAAEAPLELEAAPADPAMPVSPGENPEGDPEVNPEANSDSPAPGTALEMVPLPAGDGN